MLESTFTSPAPQEDARDKESMTWGLENSFSFIKYITLGNHPPLSGPQSTNQENGNNSCPV